MLTFFLVLSDPEEEWFRAKKAKKYKLKEQLAGGYWCPYENFLKNW